LNRRRTVRGAQIVAIGLVLVAATNLLIGGLSSEISSLTELLGYETNGLTVSPNTGDVFTEVEYQNIQAYVDSQNIIQSYVSEYSTMGFISTQQAFDVLVPFHLTNITKLLSLFYLAPTESNTSIVVTADLASALNMKTDHLYTINITAKVQVITLVTILDPNLANLNSGVYIDFSTLNWPPQIVNRFFIQLSAKPDYNRLIKDLQELGDIKIELSRAENKFLRTSADQISNTLLILQTAISILVFLSIWNVMNTIILESKDDIRLLLSLGYSRRQIWQLYVTIGAFIGFVGGILTLITSYVLVSMVLSSVSFIFDLPFIAISVNYPDIAIILLNGLIISTLSSIYPSMTGVIPE
jgi:ABC-type lipoprotein release transport system permease subunit